MNQSKKIFESAAICRHTSFAAPPETRPHGFCRKRYKERKKERKKDRKNDRKKDRKKDRKIDRQIDRKKDGQIDRQTDKQIANRYFQAIHI